VRPVIPCLLAVYAAELGRGEWAEMDPFVDDASAARRLILQLADRRLRAKKGAGQIGFEDRLPLFVGQISSGSAGAPVPALLKRKSRRPNASFVLANSARTDAGLGHLRRHGQHVQPRRFGFAGDRRERFGPATGDDHRVTLTARARATSLPIPEPPPVQWRPFFAKAYRAG